MKIELSIEVTGEALQAYKDSLEHDNNGNSVATDVFEGVDQSIRDAFHDWAGASREASQRDILVTLMSKAE